MIRVAILGPAGTVSEEAAAIFCAGIEVELIPYKIISEVFSATLDGHTDYSVIPIENTIEGSVSLHMDLLIEQDELSIQAEWVYPPRQNLIGYAAEGSEANSLAHIHKVMSHQVAIAQCSQFLKRHVAHAELENVSSTAEGVRLVKQLQDPHIAAIGTALAAERYGLAILAEDIQDNANNLTRFLLIGDKPFKGKRSDKYSYKTSLQITLPEDFPGALHQVLSAFAWRRINLTRIESRPTKKKLGSYYFLTDVVGSLDSVLLPAAIAEIEAIGCKVRILGSYPSYTYESLLSEV